MCFKKMLGGVAGLLLLATPAAADNYHYHELITKNLTSRYTAWTGYPEHQASMAPAYDPAALGLTVLHPDSEGHGEIAGSVAVSASGNSAFCASGACASWGTEFTWQHTFAGLPDAERIRWVRFEIDLYEESGGCSGSGCGGHDKDKDKHDADEHHKDSSGSPPAAYTLSGLIDFSALDLDHPSTQMEQDLAAAGVTDELRSKTENDGSVHLDYKEFSFAGLPISDYLDAAFVFDGQNPFIVSAWEG